jgi:Undecaprenyl-phosphate glucose phosphotransferase
MYEKALDPTEMRLPPESGVAARADDRDALPMRAPDLPAQRARISEEMLPGLVVIADALTIASISSLVVFVYLNLIVDEPGLQPLNYAVVTLLGIALLIQHLTVTGAYRLERLNNIRYQARKVAIAWTTVFALLVAALVLLKAAGYFSRVWLVSWYVLTPLALVGTRFCVSRALQSWTRMGYCFHTIAIVGASQIAQRFIDQVSAKPAAGLKIAAIFDDRGTRRSGSIRGVPVLGSVRDLAHYVRQSSIDMVVIALPLSADQRILGLIRQIRMLPVDIRLLSDAVGFHLSDRPFASTAGIPAINVADRPISGWGFVMKRAIDLTVASLALAVLMPLFIVTAVLIKLDSPGPVLFRQPRLGFNNNIFHIYKFRTMRTDMTDENAERLVTRSDARVTRIGRLLRRTSIDELPQLWNVIAGNMSLVGPRPHALRAKAADKLYDEAIAAYAARHRVKPGMTGWAQVNGWRGETDTIEKIQKRVEHDLYYIDHWSTAFDLYIMAKTLFIAFDARNAY